MYLVICCCFLSWEGHWFESFSVLVSENIHQKVSKFIHRTTTLKYDWWCSCCNPTNLFIMRYTAIAQRTTPVTQPTTTRVIMKYLGCWFTTVLVYSLCRWIKNKQNKQGYQWLHTVIMQCKISEKLWYCRWHKMYHFDIIFVLCTQRSLTNKMVIIYKLPVH